MDDDALDDEFSGPAFEQDGPDLFGAPAAAEPPQQPAPVQSASAAGPRVAPTQLALYRRYRPDTFAEVIGQDHVTAPLQRALTNNRVNHAYLFSGPRGCGKTTSARILARCLNCEQGPTPTPCGVCQSCRDLATGGPGSIDVIEIDAASHGGVDDARDLRERAFFAPVASRYKIYIVDEAHMVTPAGFNALLKLVEEPPPHVKFIFATTEPEKVIGTIRSRTHHYPFRLVPPKVLGAYLTKICAEEGVEIEPSVVPLVVRAGAGSVRDSLSVLDQLLGGATEHGVTYQQATGLLGFTPDSLLDEICDAFAAGDAEGVFASVDKVIEVGQDPKRFAEDLLRRLRDLVVVAAVPDAVASGLVDVADDQGERLTTQAAGFGIGELTRAAAVISNGLTEMRGTTAPRLHLELMCARVLLPGADVDERGIHARLDRLERRLGMVESGVGSAKQVGTGEVEAEAVPEPAAGQGAAERRPAAAERREPASQPSAPRPSAGRRPAVGRLDDAPARLQQSEPERPSAPTPERTPPEAAGRSQLDTAGIRRVWPEVLERVQGKRRFTWIMLSQNAQVKDVRDGVLTLAMANPGARDSWARGGNEDILREALIDVIGADLRVEAIVDGGGQPSARGQERPASRPQQRTAQPEPAPARPEPAAQRPEPEASRRSEPELPPRPAPASPRPEASQPARPGETQQTNAGQRRRPARPLTDVPEPPHDDEPPPEDDFDPDASDSQVTITPQSRDTLLRETLGASRIEEDPRP